MIIDKSKLQPLLLAVVGAWKAGDQDLHLRTDALDAFLGETTVEEVALGLLAEIEQDEMHLRAFGSVAETAVAERDQLKAENEALRKVISQSAASCGAAVSVECTLEFMSILPAEIDSVLAALRKDAERYRWLRQASATDGEYTHGVCIDLWENGCGFEVTLEEADAAVDTAMAKEANRD